MNGTPPSTKRRKDEANAKRLKALGEERARGRCAACYELIACDGPKSRYRHVCEGGPKPR